MKAIRIDGNLIVTGLSHYEAVEKHMHNASLSEDEMNVLIETGRVEFGRMTWDWKEPVKLSFDPQFREYRSVAATAWLV